MSDSVEPLTLQDRLERLQELTEFTEKCKKQINDIFEALGWSLDCKNSNQVASVCLANVSGYCSVKTTGCPVFCRHDRLVSNLTKLESIDIC